VRSNSYLFGVSGVPIVARRCSTLDGEAACESSTRWPTSLRSRPSGRRLGLRGDRVTAGARGAGPPAGHAGDADGARI